MIRTRLFIDFWNVQLHWNDYLGKDKNDKPIRIPWEQIPTSLCDIIKNKTQDAMTYAGTHVYASVDPAGDAELKAFLNKMNGFTGYSVVVKERRARPGGVRCRDCEFEIRQCPKCAKELRRTVEKGIDTAVLTDMIQMAYDDVYDMAVLGSADADLGQAIEFIQNRIGKKVYNLWFPGVGVSLRNSCWDFIRVDDLLNKLLIQIPPKKSKR